MGLEAPADAVGASAPGGPRVTGLFFHARREFCLIAQKRDPAVEQAFQRRIQGKTLLKIFVRFSLVALNQFHKAPIHIRHCKFWIDRERLVEVFEGNVERPLLETDATSVCISGG